MVDDLEANEKEHLEALERDGYPVLSLQRALERFEGSEEELEALARAGRDCLAADREAGHGTAQTVIAGLISLRASDPKQAVAYLDVVRASLKAGKRVASACAGAARPIARLDEDALGLSEGLCALAALDAKHTTEGLAFLVAALEAIPANALSLALQALPGLYQRDAEFGEAACKALARAGRVGGEDLVEAVLELLAIEPEGDAEFLPDLALALDKGQGQVTTALALAYVAALAPAARSSAGSAEDLARRLPGKVGGLASELQVPYLERVAQLTAAIGPGVIGFCGKGLPTLYSKRGAEVTDRFVERALELAEKHGRWAGQTFLLGETSAARSFLR